MGYNPGKIDGYSGHNTQEAYVDFSSDLFGNDSSVDRTPLTPDAARSSKTEYIAAMPTQAQVPSVYGAAGDESRMGMFELPGFHMRPDWNLSGKITRLYLNKKVGASAVAAISEVRKTYGEARWRSMGMDRYAGGYVNRPMRGGSSPSMHAHGIAMDFYASRNQLRWSCPQSLFCGSDYNEFLHIMASHGWLPALWLWGKDAMHFQAARLR